MISALLPSRWPITGTPMCQRRLLTARWSVSQPLNKAPSPAQVPPTSPARMPAYCSGIPCERTRKLAFHIA
ncbi:hypothetical protein D3C76_1687660 [compost metagenome]